jgi:hypothetical protein
LSRVLLPRHPVPPKQAKVYTAVDRRVAVGLVNLSQLAHHGAASPRLGKPKVDALGGADGFHPLDLVQLLDPTLDLTRLGRLVTELADEPLHLLDLVGLVPLSGLELLLPEQLLGLVIVIVAHVQTEAPQLQLRDPVHHAVEKVPVVGDDHHRPLVSREEVLDPLEGLEVQVVGRFVQQEQVRRLEQESAQGDPHSPTARQRGQRGVELVGREAQPAQDRLGARVQAVAAQRLVLVLEVAVAVHEFLGGPVLHLGHFAG